MTFCFLSRNYWSSLYHDLMAIIWEKAISILAGNLNSGHSYLITAVIRGLHIFSIECSPCYAPCQILNSRSEKYPKDYHLGFWWAATHYGCQGNVAKLRLKVYLVENRVNTVGLRLCIHFERLVRYLAKTRVNTVDWRLCIKNSRFYLVKRQLKRGRGSEITDFETT